MSEQIESLATLRDIRQMMERSSRFISLSGLSGISAGLCALAGAGVAYSRIRCWLWGSCSNGFSDGYLIEKNLTIELIIIAIITFAAAFIQAFLFTWWRSRKEGIPLFGAASWRLMWNTVIPLAVGGLFCLRMLQMELYGLVAPGCLVFYGLALVHASKYTLGEVRYLGFANILLGLINLWWIGYGLYFWAAGFGVMHIVYGAAMWWKYERKQTGSNNSDS
jgi:hypothetical protein